MSLKTKFISALTAGTAIIAFSTFISAQETKTETRPEATQKQEHREWRGGRRDGMGRRDGKGMCRGGMFSRRGGMMRGLRGIELSEGQKLQVKTIMENRRSSFSVNREEMKTIMTAKRAGTITPDQQQRLDALKTQMKENARQSREQILAILTPEQRAQMEAKKAEMKQRREQRRQLREQKKETPTEKKDNR